MASGCGVRINPNLALTLGGEETVWLRGRLWTPFALVSPGGKKALAGGSWVNGLQKLIASPTP